MFLWRLLRHQRNVRSVSALGLYPCNFGALVQSRLKRGSKLTEVNVSNIVGAKKIDKQKEKKAESEGQEKKHE